MYWGVDGGSRGRADLCVEEGASRGGAVAEYADGGARGDIAGGGGAPALLGYLDASERARDQFRICRNRCGGRLVLIDISR